MNRTELHDLIREQLASIIDEASSQSSSDMESVEISVDEFDKLNKIISSIGGDLEVAVTGELTEAPALNAASMTIAELEDGNYVLSVSKKIINEIDSYIQAGMHAKNWYTQFGLDIKSALGESDGCLFLMLFAAFSPRNSIAKNFRQAIKFFHGVKYDIENNPDKLHAVLNGNINFAELHTRIKANDETLLDLKSLSNIHNTGVLPNYYPNICRVLDLYKASNYKFNENDVFSALSNTLDTDVGMVKKSSAILSAEKVLSFAMNFIKPDGLVGETWFPVTIDTWMASLFYPELTSAEKNKLLGKHRNYTYLAKHVQKLAKQYGMIPQEMQAVLWVGKMLKTSPNLVTTMSEVFEKAIKDFEIQSTHIKDSVEYLKQIMTEIGKS